VPQGQRRIVISRYARSRIGDFGIFETPPIHEVLENHGTLKNGTLKKGAAL
jgi:hypothetical protein